MESEALRRIPTIRQIKASLDVAKSQKCKTTKSLSRTREEIGYLESTEDKSLAQALHRERRRFARQDAVVERSRKNLLDTRVKLARMVNKNRKLMELRHELQRARYRGKEPNPVETSGLAQKKFKKMGLGY